MHGEREDDTKLRARVCKKQQEDVCTSQGLVSMKGRMCVYRKREECTCGRVDTKYHL